EEEDEEEEEEEEKEEEEPSFSLTGYVDAYYQANLSSVEGEGDDNFYIPFGSSFTGLTNTFGIGNVNLLAEKTMGKVSFVGQVGFGPRAVEGNGDSNVDGDALGNFASTVQQLYVSYSPSESVTFTLGNFGTFVGYEVIDAPANMNYSMSHLFSNGPFYHTGAKVDFAFGEGFGAMVGVFNDTDSKVDAIEGKHFGGQLSYSNDQVGVYLNAITGPEAEDVSGEDNQNEFQVDLTATFQASETFMLGLNASSYSTSVDGNNTGGFFGTAVYATVATSDAFDLSLRGEYYTNTAADGDDTDQANVLGLTLSGNFKVENLRIVPEIRLDSGSNNFHGFGEDDDSAIAFLL
ncbi:MAG: porin, partial [Bacteroidota bacterium]